MRRIDGGFFPGRQRICDAGIERGGYAEYAVVKVTEAAPKPASLNFIQAGAVPLAALAAWQGLFKHGTLREGQRVLIHGGSGGVGHFANSPRRKARTHESHRR